MIKGRGQVNQQHRRGKDNRTTEKGDVAMVKRRQEEYRCADDRPYEADPMANTIRHFLGG